LINDRAFQALDANLLHNFVLSLRAMIAQNRSAGWRQLLQR
jgi:hypothetical protein